MRRAHSIAAESVEHAPDAGMDYPGSTRGAEELGRLGVGDVRNDIEPEACPAFSIAEMDLYVRVSWVPGLIEVVVEGDQGFDYFRNLVLRS